MNTLSSKEIIDYITMLNIIDNLYDDKQYSYTKILLKQEYEIYYN